MRQNINSPEGEVTSKDHPDSIFSIIKSTSVLSVGTLASRIFGFIRDVILAKLLGTGFRADAFFVALKIPNLFRDLIGEGAANAAVVPVFSEYLEKKKRERFWAFVSVVLTLALVILSIVTIAGILAAPIIVRMIVPGFIAEPDKLLLTIHLTKIMFPYLVFIGLTAHSVGILYTFRSFIIPAFSPCLLNISIIVSALIASSTMEEPVFGIAIGVLVGGALQLAVQIPPLLKTGIRYIKPKKLNDPGAIKIGRLLIPRMFGSGVYQLTVLIDTFCASLSTIVGAGGISAIYYANRIIQFPMGIFSVALASAVLPSLSGLATKKDIKTLKKTLVFSLESIIYVMCPTVVVLLLLSTPIIQVLFQRGEFDYHSTTITSNALTFYSIGLFSFGGIKILVTAFHALQDTKTPVKVAALCLVINASLNFILMFPFKIGGIALASSIAGTIDFIILYYVLDKKLGGLDGGLIKFFLKIALSSGVMGFLQIWAWTSLDSDNLIFKLSLIGGAGFIVYGFLSSFLGVAQSKNIGKWILRKK